MFLLVFFLLAALKSELTQCWILESLLPHGGNEMQHFLCSQMNLAYNREPYSTQELAFREVTASHISCLLWFFVSTILRLKLECLPFGFGLADESRGKGIRNCLLKPQFWFLLVALNIFHALDKFWDLLLACSSSVLRQGHWSHTISPLGCVAFAMSQGRGLLMLAIISGKMTI